MIKNLALYALAAGGIAEIDGRPAFAPTTDDQNRVDHQVAGELIRRDWRVSSSDSLSIDPPKSAIVEAYIRSKLADLSDGIDIAQVCDYTFLKVAGYKQYILLASVDESGREFCNSVVVTSNSQNAAPAQVIPAWQATSVSALLHDIRGTGATQVIIPTIWSDYEGTRCVATWPKIYQFNGSKLTDVSSSYPDYYKALLKKLDSATETTTPATQPETNCQIMEHDKLLRNLGIAPRAGYARSQGWMQSQDPSDRRKAATVFGDIGDMASLANLAVLAHDPDATVRETASSILAKKQNSP